mgnify:CR=1 FL=1
MISKAAALSGVGLWQSSQVGITAKEASEQAAAAGSMMDAQTYMDYESDQKMWQQGAMGAAIAAGTFALSTIVMSLFTDWDGHGSGESDED